MSTVVYFAPIHMNATILGLYVHPLEEGDYRMLHWSNEKPYRYGYCSVVRQTHTWIYHAVASEQVSWILWEWDEWVSITTSFLHGALHWLHWLQFGSLGLKVLVFDATTCLFWFLKPPPAGSLITRLRCRWRSPRFVCCWRWYHGLKTLTNIGTPCISHFGGG